MITDSIAERYYGSRDPHVGETAARNGRRQWNMKNETERNLYDSLKELCAETYPFHMPGHKRRIMPSPELPYDIDITEINGSDNLHNAEGILKEAMHRTSVLYGVQRTWYLVNGSTVGVLAAVRSAAPAGSELIMARNCHKSAYHAVEISGLTVHYIYPQTDPLFGIYGSMDPQTVEQALEKYPLSKAVVMTSPTYDGVISDIETIAAVCHAHGVPLVVDEAHGAHLGLGPGFPEGATDCGADLVVQSPHKVLPSMTQTAWMHLNSGRIREAEVERQLEIFETTSPSYPMLCSLDACTKLMQEQGKELIGKWGDMLSEFDRMTADLRYLRILCHGADGLQNHPSFYLHDPGKILVNGSGAGLTGKQMAALLRSRYAFEPEMYCGGNVLAMTSVADDPAAIRRLADALCEMDAEVPETAADGHAVQVPEQQEQDGELSPGDYAAGYFTARTEAVCTIAEALAQPSEEVPAKCARGRILGEYIWAYPPGVPLGVPGERISRELLDTVCRLEAMGTPVYHRGSGYAADESIDKPRFRCVS
jgi:arginine decarboxylase